MAFHLVAHLNLWVISYESVSLVLVRNNTVDIARQRLQGTKHLLNVQNDSTSVLSKEKHLGPKNESARR